MPPKQSVSLETLSQNQQERLSYIDFRLLFLGSIQRNDLLKRFGMKPAAATRDITLYRQLAPENLSYNTKARAYLYKDTFTPLFNYQAERALSALSTGFGDDFVGINQPSVVLCDTPTSLSPTRIPVLAVLTRAIYQQKVIDLHYYSLTSGFTERQVIPFALVDNGLRWHIRAYDRRREQFTDFVINRIESPHIIDSGDAAQISANETKEADIQWNRIVELEIVPHPKLKHPESIIKDYGMQNDVLNINIRAVVAGYLLRRWNIDCSADHSLVGDEYHLWLKNYPTLYGVSSNAIAPGYQEP